MTDSQPGFKEQKAPWSGAEAETSFEPAAANSHRRNGEAIAAGLAYLFEHRRNGRWPSAARPECDDKKMIPTATAVSALVMGDFQPGLYLGSDLPQARRLHES